MHHHHHIRRQVDPVGFDLGNELNVLENGVKLIESNVATLVSVVYVTAAPTFQGPVGGYTTIAPVAPVQTPTVKPPASALVPTTGAEESTALEISSALAQSFVLPSSDALPITSTRPTNTVHTSSSLLDSVQVTTTPSATQASFQPSSMGESFSYVPLASAASATSTPIVTSQGSTGLSSGAKAGVAIGVILGLVALLAVAALCLLHRKKQKNKAYGSAEDEKNPFGDRAAVPAPTPARISPPPHLSLRESTQPRTHGVVSTSGVLRNVDNVEVEKATTALDPKANPFGQSAEVSRANQDIPAPLRIATVTSDNTPAFVEGGAIAEVASTTIVKRHDSPVTRDIRPVVTPGLRQPIDGAMPSPAGTEYSMASLSVDATAAGVTPVNVHRIQLDFKPSMEDELELKAGQLVRLLHEYDDGWALCIRLDRSQQGVAPRTCLSARPVKPRSKPSDNPPPALYLSAQGRDHLPRSMSPRVKTRSNSVGDARGNSLVGLSPMNPNAQSALRSSEGIRGSSTVVQSVATLNDPTPKRKPVPGRTM